MSRSELISSYQNGRIDRRTLVKGLMALGMSATIATAMADRLRAAPAPKGQLSGRFQDDSYDDTYGEDPGTGTGGVSELPNTGAPTAESQSNWMAPAAAIGAAAAFVAHKI